MEPVTLKANCNIRVGSHVHALCTRSLKFRKITANAITATDTGHNSERCPACGAIAEWARQEEVKTRAMRGWYVSPDHGLMRDVRHGRHTFKAPKAYAFMEASLKAKAKFQGITIEQVPVFLGWLASMDYPTRMVLADSMMEVIGMETDE